MISILMTGRLVANSLNALVLPIVESKYVDEICFVADVPGPPMSKIVYRCPPQWMQKIFGRYLAKLILLFQIGLKKKPDLVHAFSMFPHGISAFLISKLLKTKSCISIIAAKDVIVDGGLQGDNWLLRKGGKKPWLEKIFIHILRKTEIVTVMGTNTKAFLKSKAIPYVIVLPLFIDSGRFHPLDENRDIDVISASSLIPRKRIDLLLEATAKIKSEQIKVKILGKGELSDELKRLASSLNISQNVHFKGFTDEFEYELQRSKLFFMASNMEGLSIAMLMAMACGTVPLVRDVGDLIQAAHHEKNSLVLQTDNPHAFAQAIDYVLDNDEIWQKLSLGAVQYIHEKYSMSQCSQEWNEIYSYHFS